MAFVVAAGFLCVFATSPPYISTGSCATVSGNRCNIDYGTAMGCGCDVECLTRKDCCADYSTVCVGSCPANSADVFACRDGTECDPLTHPAAYGCCGAHGGKFKCPSSLPYMCTGVNGASCGDDHCCFSTPYMCAHHSVDRSLLQDCPTLKSDGKPNICPYNHGPQQLLPNMTNSIGSYAHRFFWLKEAASMETREDGKFAPGVSEWPFCPPHDEATKMLCKNGTQCDVRVDGWACCAESGRLRCPSEFPVMCAEKTCAGDDHCCATSGIISPPLALDDCPTPDDGVIPSTSEKAVRQCSANAPVLCSDNSCAVAKSDCDGGMQTACPLVPKCEATGEWEATPVGGTAYALCGEDADGNPLEGRKYRACVSTFEAGEEIAQWDRIMDGGHICRPVVPKCSNVVTQNGDRVPYLPVDSFTYIPMSGCPLGMEGVSVYHCVLCPATNETKHEIIPLCDLPCARDGYCSGNGGATSAAHDLSFALGNSCQCTCDAQWTGKHCDEKIEPTPTGKNDKAARKKLSMRWLLWVSLGMLFAALALLVCAVMLKVVPNTSRTPDSQMSEADVDIEHQMNAASDSSIDGPDDDKHASPHVKARE